MRHALLPLLPFLIITCSSQTPVVDSAVRSAAVLPAAVPVAHRMGDVANALSWGFDPVDATASLQGAIDSGAPTVIVPAMASPWMVGPIVLRSDLELVLEEGAVIEAREGLFLSRAANLLYAENVQNLILRGRGGTLRMRKADYQKEPYQKAQWRHAVSLNSVKNVTISGLRIESSGGDGIYLGMSREPGSAQFCEDIVIRDVIITDNHRQGISVISARNLLIERSVLSKTRGTAPRAGIDFEPNQPYQQLVNCVVRECRILDNAGAGVQVFLKKLDETSTPVSIVVEDCVIRGNTLAVWVTPAGGQPSGSVRFVGGDIGRPRLLRRTKTLDISFVD